MYLRSPRVGASKVNHGGDVRRRVEKLLEACALYAHEKNAIGWTYNEWRTVCGVHTIPSLVRKQRAATGCSVNACVGARAKIWSLFSGSKVKACSEICTDVYPGARSRGGAPSALLPTTFSQQTSSSSHHAPCKTAGACLRNQTVSAVYRPTAERATLCSVLCAVVRSIFLLVTVRLPYYFVIQQIMK